jgi:hypothetical protein
MAGKMGERCNSIQIRGVLQEWVKLLAATIIPKVSVHMHHFRLYANSE